METNVLLNIGFAAFGALLGYLGYKRNSDKDTAASGKSNGVVLTEIGYIKSGIDDIKTEQRDMRKANQEVFTRLATVEASAKQAHKRLDEMGGKYHE